jgi:hypothetical protein
MQLISRIFEDRSFDRRHRSNTTKNLDPNFSWELTGINLLLFNDLLTNDRADLWRVSLRRLNMYGQLIGLVGEALSTWSA